MKNTEVEIQVGIEHLKPLLALLKKQGKFLYKEKQIDQYFTPFHRNFKLKDPIEEWLRLRNSNGKYSITYKNWHRQRDKKAHHCDEYESGLEKIDQIEKIFQALNFKPVVKVEKLREVYKYKSYEIAIDKVKNLGDFVEIEYKGNTKKKPEKITEDMIQFLKDLNLGEITRNHVGYAYKLLYPKGNYLEEEL